MELRLEPEKEAQLAQIAAQRGLRTDELAQLVLSRYLEDDTRFIQAVNLRLLIAVSLWSMTKSAPRFRTYCGGNAPTLDHTRYPRRLQRCSSHPAGQSRCCRDGGKDSLRWLWRSGKLPSSRSQGAD
jgi:hypothetical protein